ncbi:hypothetical protein C8A01DRAFT_34418 [Parachaetomium inaequale]|uniref:Uncharacterized protein n=1 Tax=Parachaetomium inaequale TaxID=2588326 RepID=A0AAN6PJ28_9PEZI|nr:hypothetical protein C8A01DRAFT_34418 [Parachaetomium inaequale]
METQTRSRPELRPVWTGRGDQHPAYPRTTPHSATSPGPLYSASLSLPSPLYPASPGYDHTMRAHERALVDRLDRLDQRGRRGSQQSPITARSLSPIAEQTPSTRRVSVASLPLPSAPAPSPRSPSLMQYPGPQTIAAQTREILLEGVPDGLPRPPPASAGAVDDRRQSLPFSVPSERRNSQEIRDELRDWGHVYFGNGPIADCFVSAVALRRHSDSSSAVEDAAAKETPPGGGNRVTIRTRVRPCALDRKPFLLTRTFDMDGIRATIPELSPVSAGPRRPSNDHHISRTPLPTRRRRSSMAAGAKHGLDLDRSHVQNTNTVPIHAKYALAFLPVLAAFIFSKLIHKGDIVDLPLPYPKAWAQTVAYVYTGQGELTEAIKQNIVYLGGKV